MRVVVSTLIACLVAISATAQTGPARFSKFPVASIYNGNNAKPMIDKDSKRFRTRVRWAAEGRRDFAGEYIFAQFGCGTSCRTTFVVNARTGRVSWLPFTLCCAEPFDADPVAYRLNSRLVAFRGLRNEGNGPYSEDKASDVHFYELKNGRFRFIKTVRQ